VKQSVLEMVLDMRMKRNELQHALERYLAKMCIIWNASYSNLVVI